MEPSVMCGGPNAGVTWLLPLTELPLDVVKGMIDEAAEKGMKALSPAKKGLL